MILRWLMAALLSVGTLSVAHATFSPETMSLTDLSLAGIYYPANSGTFINMRTALMNPPWPLNATVSSLSGNISGNPTLTGSVTFSQQTTMPQAVLGLNQNFSSSGSTLNPIFNDVGSCTGSYSTGGFGGCNQMINGNDTLVYSGQGFAELYLSTTAGSGAQGNRDGLMVNLGIPVTVAANGGNRQHVVGEFQGSMSANQGGTNPVSGQSAGSLFGINPNVILRSGATDIAGLIGQENDVAVVSGATVMQKTGLQIIETTSDAVQGHDWDFALLVGDQNSSSMVGWKNIFVVGASGWPLSPTNGVVFESLPQSSEYVSSGVTMQLQAATGLGGVWLDTLDVASNSGYTFRGDGFATDGAGQVYSANAVLGTTATGIRLDVPNQIVTSASVSTPGGAVTAPLYPGDEMYGLSTGPYRGIYKITHTQAISGSTIASAGSGGTTGSQTVTLSGGTCGTAPQFNVTVALGAISAINSVTTAGDCTAYAGSPPTNYAWPVTGGGLTGATINVAFGAKTVAVVVPDVSSSTPSTIALSDDGGSNTRGVVITPTWSARQVLTLNPSGDTVAGLGTQLGSLSATSGFFHLPYTNATSGSGGIPTGTPANTAGPACVWNDVTFVLDCYSPSAGAWKHVSFSSSAG